MVRTVRPGYEVGVDRVGSGHVRKHARWSVWVRRGEMEQAGLSGEV